MLIIVREIEDLFFSNIPFEWMPVEFVYFQDR